MTYFAYYIAPFNAKMIGDIDILVLCAHIVINQNRFVTNSIESRKFQSMKEQWTMTINYLH